MIAKQTNWWIVDVVRNFLNCSFGLIFVCLLAGLGRAQVPAAVMPENHLAYDLLLRGGHVIDDRNGVDGVRDVGIKDGKIARVAEHLDAKDALKTVDVTGYVVTPGLIDIHVHAYAGTGAAGIYEGDNSVYPDGFTLRNGVTTVVDAGSSGWRTFDDFKQRVIDRQKTRVLAELNIVGWGMHGDPWEQDLSDMDGKLTGEKAKQFPGVIVGIKTAHYEGPEWKPVDEGEKAGRMAGIPLMVDFGDNRPERPLLELAEKHLRAGDIYTHCFSGLRGEQNPVTGGPSDALLAMRRRGIYCDIGHGGGSFAWTVALPIVKAGYLPDSISTDLHITSMNAGMKDLLNVADKLLAVGESLHDVIAGMTSHPAHEIQQEQLGNLSVGAPADVAVLSVEHGKFGFTDMYNSRLMGTEKLVCQMTLRDGKVVYDLNGISADAWDAKEHSADVRQKSRWTTFNERAVPKTAFPVSTPADQRVPPM